MKDGKGIEVFSAGCAVCDDLVTQIEELSGSRLEVEVLDMHVPETARRARELGIRALPAVAIDGKLAGCCSSLGPDIAALRALFGQTVA